RRSLRTRLDGRGQRRIRRWWTRRPCCGQVADSERATSSLPQGPSPAAFSSERFAYHVSRDEGHVRRTFGEAPHEIRVPLRTEGHVDPHSIAIVHQLLLEVAPHAVQHLKLEAR